MSFEKVEEILSGQDENKQAVDSIVRKVEVEFGQVMWNHRQTEKEIKRKREELQELEKRSREEEQCIQEVQKVLKVVEGMFLGKK
jgi:uncharacterized protein with WD repeat